MGVGEGVGCGCGSGHDCGCGWQRDIYLHAPLSHCTLSTAGRDNPQINMTFLQAQTCVHMGLCSELQASPVELSPSTSRN